MVVSSGVQGLRRYAGDAWVRYSAALILPLLTLLGASLRVFRIDANSYNLDEIYALWMVQQNTSDIVQTILLRGLDATPPVYYILLRSLVLIGQQPLFVRALSVLAGTLIVWLTFHLARYLFGRRVAALSACFVAVAPLHIQYSQVARAYMLSDLWALLSLYFFTRLVFDQKSRRWHWIGLVIASAAAIYTHYLTIFLVLFENLFVVLLWLRHYLTRSWLCKWLVSQIALGLALLPTGLFLFLVLTDPQVEPGRGQTWIPTPGLQALIKSVILFTTGDPSYGGTGVTPARIFGLIAIAGITLLGLGVFLRDYRRAGNPEGPRVVLMACAILVPWMAVFALGRLRPLYHEKYFLFLMSPWMILIAWTFTRARRTIASGLLILAYVSLVGRALFVYYTAPVGEQWHEAIAYLRSEYQAGDLVVISPSYYIRPFTYYFDGGFPEDVYVLSHAPDGVMLENGSYRSLDLHNRAQASRVYDVASTTVQRVWLVSGYQPAALPVIAWIEQNFEPLQAGEFLGAHVQLLQRVQPPGQLK
jgi:uncharacterized membrane protein